MKKINNLVFGILLFPLAVFAQQMDYSKAIPFDPSVKTGKLENGLTYYIKKNAKPEKKHKKTVVTCFTLLIVSDLWGKSTKKHCWQ